MKINSFLFLALAVLSTSCNRNIVKVSSTNAKSKVPALGNLEFTFNNDLVPDSLLHKWKTEKYISFEPKIQGKFRWQNNRSLVFSPAVPLKPATTYKAKINTSVLKYSKVNKLENKDLAFHTEPLQIKNTNFLWTMTEGTKQVLPELSIEFNYIVKPEELSQQLQIQVDEEIVPIKILTAKAGKLIKVAVPINDIEDRDYKIKLTLKKGTKPVGGSNGTKENSSLSSVLTSPFQLYINDMNARHDGEMGIVTFKTSQQVGVIKDLQTELKISPSVEIKIEETDGGFVIKSEEFLPDEIYDISIRKGLKGVLGGVLSEKYSSSVSFGELEPEVAFATSENIYLSKKGNKNIEVKINNVKKVKVILSKIYEKNLLSADRHGYYPSDKHDEDYYEDDGNSDYVKGDVVFEKEIDTKLLSRTKGGSRIYTLIPDEILKNFNGIYHLKIRSTKDYWLNDSRFISLSDIGLITKVGKNKIHVFANSISTANPMSGIAVSVYGGNNQLLEKATTNSMGHATINFSSKPFKGFQPAMVVAKSGNDFNYMPLSKTAVNTSRYDVGGRRANKSGIDLFMYAERNMYRPQEKINFAMIARKNNRSNPGSLPIRIKIIQPNGKVLKNYKQLLNSQGGAEGSFITTEDGQTGTYIVQAFYGDNLLLNQMSIGVEEFVPDRLKVNLKKLPTQLNVGDTININVTAMNFFGTEAGNRAYETEIQIAEKHFSAPHFEQYDFDLSNQRSSFSKERTEGKTNTLGQATATYVIPEIYNNSGLLQANVFATVFDETSRPVSRNQKIDIHTQDVYFGVYSAGYRYFPLSKNAKFKLVALNKNGKLSQGKAQIDIMKYDYKNVMTRSGNYYQYRSQEEMKILESKEMMINGKESFYNFMPKTAGDYEIRISIPGANNYVSQRFHSYGSWGNSNSFSVNKEGTIDIEFDKEKYKKGDQVKVLFKTPFNGKLLVTTENENVLTEKYLEVKNRTASMTFTLKDKDVPNIYVNATLFKSHSESQMPLTVAHGIKHLKVDDFSGQMKMTISANKTSRSHKKQTIRIKAEPNAMISLAIVDNGILAVNDYKSPSPYDFFFGKKQLGVNSYDMYALLFPEIKRHLSKTGGDRGANMNQRLNPIKGKRIKLLSHWSGLKKCNRKGYVDVEMDIPEFNGEVRIMAVGYKNNKFGMAEETMIVADPIILSTALPRFMSSGDSIPVAVFVTNTTQNDSDIKLKLNNSGPIKSLGLSEKNIRIKAESEQVVLFTIKADQNIGESQIKITADGMGEQFVSNTSLPIRPASPLIIKEGSGFLSNGNAQTIDLQSTDMIARSVHSKLFVGRSPILQLGGNFSYLVNYPHGCTEQIISSAFPQLYYSTMANLFKQGRKSKSTSLENVEQVIQKIKARQLYNGGIRLWDGDNEAHWWASVYAGDFLIEAQEAGFVVDKNVLYPLLSYLSARLRTKETITYYYNKDEKKKIAPKEVSYSLYVLAKAHKPNVPAMNYYKANSTELALDGKYLLAAAYALAGDKKSFEQILPNSFSGEKSKTQTGGSFYSYERDLGLALNVLLTVNPDHPQVVTMSNAVVQQLKKENQKTTQGSVYGLLAIGKMSKELLKTEGTAKLQINGDNVNVRNNVQEINLNSQSKVELKLLSNNKVYYWWQTKGINAKVQVQEKDNFLRVRRSFYSRDGKLLTANSFKQNDLIVVKISLDQKYTGLTENVVVTDLLPAGFEIENPRIKEVQGLDWVKDASTARQMDIRDDRIFFFTNAKVEPKHFYYVVRAVTPGNFKLGPVSADAMYNPMFHSVYGAGNINVIKKKINAVAIK